MKTLSFLPNVDAQIKDMLVPIRPYCTEWIGEGNCCEFVAVQKDVAAHFDWRRLVEYEERGDVLNISLRFHHKQLPIKPGDEYVRTELTGDITVTIVFRDPIFN